MVDDTVYTEAIQRANAADTRADEFIKARDNAITDLTTQTKALASANATINDLQKRIDTLSAQVAGADGTYTIAVPAVVQVALGLEAVDRKMTPQEVFAEKTLTLVRQIGESKVNQVFALAMGEFPKQLQANQLAILTILGLEQFASVPVDVLMGTMGPVILQKYLELNRDNQTEIMKLLGLSS